MLNYYTYLVVVSKLGRYNGDMLIDFCMTYTTLFQLTLTTTMSTLPFDLNPEP